MSNASPYRFSEDSPTHLDSSSVYTSQRTISFFLFSFSLKRSISRGARRPKLTRCAFPDLSLPRDLHCPLKCVFHDSVDRPLPHTQSPFISPINFDSSQCRSAPRLARSYRIRVGLPTTAKLDLTRLLDGRVITCKNITR